MENVKIRIQKLSPSKKQERKTFVDVVINELFLVKGITAIRTNEGLRIFLPALFTESKVRYTIFTLLGKENFDEFLNMIRKELALLVPGILNPLEENQ